MMQIQIKKLVAQCMSEAKHCNKLSKELLLLRTEVQQVVTKCKKWRVNYKLVFYLKEDQRHLATMVILAQVTVMHIVSTNKFFLVYRVTLKHYFDSYGLKHLDSS